MTTTIDSSMVGEVCTFRTKNPNDTVTWQGTIQAVGSSIIAQAYTDIVAYNAAVRLVDPTVSQDPTTLSYFVISLSNATTQQNFAFSSAWLIDGSFELITQNVPVTVIVYDAPTNDHNGILTVLRAAGYTCYIQPASTVVSTPVPTV